MDDEPQLPQKVSKAKKPKLYKLEPEPGGEFPELSGLFNETLEEFQDNITPYVFAGLAQFAVMLPVVFLGIFGLYFGIALGMGGTMVIGGILGGMIMEYVSEGLGLVVMLATQFVAILVPFLLIFLFIGFLAAVLAPFNASLVRAVAAHQRGQKELDFPEVFSTISQDLPKVIGAALILSGLTIVGLFMCYLPALAVPIVFGFASSLVAMHRLGPTDGVKSAFTHFSQHMNWHLTFGVVYVGMSMVAGYVPVLGPAFLLALHTRAYRKVFGDGEAPVL